MSEQKPLTVAWFSYFPVEWLPDLPEELKYLPRQHAASWQRVLLGELEGRPGIKLHILILRKQFRQNSSFERNGVTFHLIKAPGGLRAPSLFWIDTVLIGRALRRIRPDVVHAWGTENGAATVANRLGYPRVVTVQGLFLWYGQVVPLRPYQKLARAIERFSLPRSRLVTTESRFSVNFIRERFPRLEVRQIEHAPDVLFHQVQRRPRTKPVRLLFVGTFDYRKGADVLLSALNEWTGPELEVVVVGDRARPEILAMIPNLKPGVLERFVFKESLKPAEIGEELAATTMMICPTRADVSPNAVKEAVVAGVPVVATGVGGILDYVVPGKNGVLFPANDVAACIAGLKEACAHPLFSQGRVDEATLATQRVYLSAKTMGEQFLAVYRHAAAVQR